MNFHVGEIYKERGENPAGMAYSVFLQTGWLLVGERIV